MGKILKGAAVKLLEHKNGGKPIEEILMPYLRFKMPLPKVAAELQVSLPTVRHWFRKLKLIRQGGK